MTQKSAKKKSKKSSKPDGEPSVLGSLRATRPTRLGGDHRASATRSRASARPVATGSTAKPAAAAPPKAKAKRSPAAAAPPKAKRGRSPGTAAQSKASAARRPAPPPTTDGRGRGTKIVTTAAQAAGELAQIGVTVGSRFLKGVYRRIARR